MQSNTTCPAIVHESYVKTFLEKSFKLYGDFGGCSLYYIILRGVSNILSTPIDIVVHPTSITLNIIPFMKVNFTVGLCQFS